MAIFIGAGIYFLKVVAGIIVGLISAGAIYYAVEEFVVEKPAKKEASKKIARLYPEQV